MAERNSLVYNAAMTVMESEHSGNRDAKAFLPEKNKRTSFITGQFSMLLTTLTIPLV